MRLEHVASVTVNPDHGICYTNISILAASAFCKSGKIRASDPSTFNDPFEVRPAVDQEPKDHFMRGYERFHGSERRSDVSRIKVGTRQMKN
jgi:hypothetical protein